MGQLAWQKILNKDFIVPRQKEQETLFLECERMKTCEIIKEAYVRTLEI